MEPGQRLTGQVAIVSGGASGSGAETARTFGTHGASVVVGDVNATAGEAVAASQAAARDHRCIVGRARPYHGLARQQAFCERFPVPGLLS